jgi:prophage regulatory protein
MIDQSLTFISPRHAAGKFGISLATLWRWVKYRNDFPRPVRFSPGCTRFCVQELEAYAGKLGAGK